MILLALMPLMTFFMAVDNTIDGENIIQKDYELYYQKGNEKTPYTGNAIYYTEGKKREEGSFKDGKKEGVWKHYTNNGKLFIDTNYLDGRKSGFENFYSEEGKKVLSIHYNKKGFKNFERGVRPDGKEFSGSFWDNIPWDEEIKEDFPWGPYQHGQGNPYYKEKYVSYNRGIREGLTIWFGHDNKIIAEGNYVNDERWQGKFVIPRSKFLWEIVSYSEGIPDGEVHYFKLVSVNSKLGDCFEEIKPCGVYKEGQRWQGLFMNPSSTEHYVWEQMFYEDGKLIKKEYAKIYVSICIP